MASPTAPEDPPAPEGAGLLERLGEQLSTLAARVAEIDSRMTSVEAVTSDQPVEVQLSAETVAQIAEALAALQAAGSQALDDVFKSATDDLTEALSKLVTAEISRTLADAGYEVAVAEAPDPMAATQTDDEGLLDVVPVAASASPSTEPAAMPAIVAPLAAGDSMAEVDAEPDNAAGTDEGDEAADEVSMDGPPLALDELDDPFLDALIRKEPLSA